MSRADNWRTPPEIFEALNREFKFDLDAAAAPDNALLPRFLSLQWDALTMDDWPGQRIFLNPPYGCMLAPFIETAAREASKGKLLVALVPLRMRAAWFHDFVIGKAREVRAVRKRIKFLRPDGTRPNFTGSCDSMIIVWDGPATDTRITAWEQPRISD